MKGKSEKKTAYESALARYERQIARTRKQRMQWWHDAHFGMFVHWGLYSILGRHEWAMNRERIPVAEYEKLTKRFHPKPRPAREWARLAKAAGMKYMVMTTKHHEGFCLWDTKMTDYNAVARGPGRDLVREYVEACREFGLKIGFYYSLMDWHHPDGARCAKDKKARRRFLDFTQGCVRELMSSYGKIDILWYDVAWPLKTAAGWESLKMNRMARELQPHILINNRSYLPEDFCTPEERIKPTEKGRAWEACMTFNRAWGYQPTPPEDWHSVRSVLNLLRECVGNNGNLLLNIGPKADGSVPPEAVERLTAVGKWLKKNGEAVYGETDRIEGRFEWLATGQWTLRGKTAYLWCRRWAGKELVLGGVKGKLRKVSLLPGRKSIPFVQEKNRVILRGLPKSNPDKIALISVFRLEFDTRPSQKLGSGYVVL